MWERTTEGIPLQLSPYLQLVSDKAKAGHTFALNRAECALISCSRWHTGALYRLDQEHLKPVLLTYSEIFEAHYKRTKRRKIIENVHGGQSGYPTFQQLQQTQHSQKQMHELALSYHGSQCYC